MKYSVAASVLILIILLMPGRNIPDVGMGGVDKLVHFAMFAVWTVVVRYDFDRDPFPFLLTFIIGVLFGVVTEVLQMLAEERTFDLLDMGANVLGVIGGLIVSGPITRFVKRRF